MDRSPYPPRVHSRSTSALIPDTTRNTSGYNGGHANGERASLGHINSDGALTSHLLPSGTQPSDTFGEQTWLDFLRESGTNDTNGPYPNFLGNFNFEASGSREEPRVAQTTLESHEASSADRKRRLTAPESPARRPGYGASTFTSPPPQNLLNTQPPAMTPAGTSVNTAIDLISSSPQPSYRSRLSAASTEGDLRKGSDIMLPPWQPDSEVLQCPVCGNSFSFWFRKHHCRKCGRVVCANCSPHRITIPRQFIVHPPCESVSGGGLTIIDLTSDTEDSTIMSSFGPYRNPALGGGEEVRVCNPCVPDPNFSPPPQHHQDQVGQETWRFPNFDQGMSPSQPQPQPQPQPQGRPRNTTYDQSPASISRPSHPYHRPSQSDFSQARPDQARNRPPPDPFRDRNASFYNNTRASDLWPPQPRPPSNSPSTTTGTHTRRTTLTRPHSHYIPQQPQLHLHHHHHHSNSTSSASPSRYHSLLDVNAPLPPTPAPPPPPRQIAEEDECPVCGNELPPRGPDGGEAEREAHVEECIRSHFSGSSSTIPPVPSTAAPINAAVAGAGGGMLGTSVLTASTSLPGTGSGNGGPSRPRRATASNRMLVYEATEKDCVGEEGEAQECVICFEEFEEGDQMGRLCCLCKFHKSCIRKWWETKGPGSCPTHQLHD
ncbi:FYVE-domain-containing protein [Lepidopterella palustris CBS 459.81]|uniref:RING-type E3 ubiquitin transferase n=1 Tax=Lepidopterella palustris CBS 459.81 TaxID=1314670 RepID=A0A8E2EGJ2_9PEZI|nr:FYVE-domain-containing protein [Lepidopterella palustris CBS 459.81]